MNTLQSCLLVVVMAAIISCSGDSNDAATDTKALLTSGTWKLNAVTIDGVNKNNLYTNFTLAFSSAGFTAINGEPVWPSSGTWAFASADQKSFTRNDGVEVTLNEISESELTLTLTWNKNTLGGGRAASTEGDYTFVLNK